MQIRRLIFACLAIGVAVLGGLGVIASAYLAPDVPAAMVAEHSAQVSVYAVALVFCLILGAVGVCALIPPETSQDAGREYPYVMWDGDADAPTDAMFAEQRRRPPSTAPA